ncbi:GNAT family N-acetyltransferase [Pelosinus sp. sgz500959]|uniref:GNAT family N-acetyltransferase n=1 Tax=Pelosinus sp. sgz500959 TaxID=3242472 RepID=UPI0036723AD1
MITINQGSKSFYVGDSKVEPLAEMVFTSSDKDIIIIDHTFVSDELRGQNVGRQLLQKVVDWARTENKKIVPLCPFAKAEMMKNSEYKDVLHQ